MNRNLYFLFACYQGISSNVGDSEDFPKYEISQDNLMNVLSEIFSVDEVTGLPKGDIAYYLSPDGNPQVKLWLENNLLKPRLSKGSSIDGLTDDLIEEFARRSSESVDEYSSRLRGYYDSALAEYKKSLDLKTD